MNVSLILFMFAWTGDLAFQPKEEHWKLLEVQDATQLGLYFIEETVTLLPDQMETQLVARICGKQGISYFNYLRFAEDITGFEGTIWYPNGESSPILADKHLVEILQFEYMGYDAKQLSLVLEGLTRDCIVGLRWIRPLDRGVPKDQLELDVPIQRTAYIQEKTIVVTPEMESLQKILYSDSILSLLTKMTWDHQTHFQHQFYSDGQNKVLRYTNLPSYTHEPLSHPKLNLAKKAFQIYKTLGLEDSDPNEYWLSFCQGFLKLTYNEQAIWGPAGKAFLNQIKGGLAGNKKEDAQFIVNAFQDKVKNPYLLNPNQPIPKELPFDPFEDDFMENLLIKGVGDPGSYDYALFKLLDYFNLEPKLVMGANSWQSHFDPTAMRLSQINFSNVLIAIEDETGGRFYFCPAAPHAKQGSIPDEFRGGTMLYIDPQNEWKPQWLEPKRKPSKLQSVSQVHWTVDGIEQTISKRWTGHLAEEKRKRLVAFDHDNLIQSTGFQLEEENPGWKVLGIGWSQVDQSEKPLDMKAKIATTAQAAFQPFRPIFLESPAWWPENRVTDFDLKFPFVVQEQVTFQCPPAKSIRVKAWEKENEIGAVKVSQDDSKLYRYIQLKQSQPSSNLKTQIEDFFRWVHQSQQTLAFLEEES